MRTRPLSVLLFPLFLPFSLVAAPLASDDAYSVDEDQVLNATGGVLFDTGFDGSVGQVTNWKYLDRIENTLGRGDSYPLDGSNRVWNASNFNTATSTIGPWSNGSVPIQSGGIAPFPAGLPDLLFGIDAAPNGIDNLVNTYLFRGNLTLNAAEAAIANWTMHVLADDGCIIYINGTEVGRQNMESGQYSPAGPVGTNTLPNNSNESYSDIAVNLSGVLISGVNSIAVEVHQSTVDSTDVGFDFSMAPTGENTSGFVFNNYNTQNAQSAGVVDAAGFTGKGLLITAGGSTSNAAARGAWERDFSLSSPGTIELILRYRMIFDSGYESDEYSQIYVQIDGTPHGVFGNSYLARFFGNGNGGADNDTGWQTITFNVPLSLGNHTLTLGVFNSKSSVTSEITRAYFDDVSVLLPGGILGNDTGNAATLTSVLVDNASNGSATVNSDGTFVYTPNPNFFGSDSFTYHAVDNTGTSNTATVTITVDPVNDAPLAVNNSYNVTEDVPLNITVPAFGVLGNDTDVENDTLIAVLGSGVSKGTLSLSGNGTFTYTPNLNFNGSDSFTYTASDGIASSNTATVTLTIQPVNDAPQPANDSYTTFQDSPLTVSIASNPGSTTIVAAGSSWKYLDNGSNQGAAWRNSSFNDASWASGNAKFGYGDGDEAQVIGYGPDENNKYITSYFRRAFTVTNPTGIGRLVVSLRRDDGAAVYLNGVEVVRDQLSANAAYNVFALSAASGNDELTFFDFEIDPGALVAGTNVLAVEAHQSSLGSTDLGFDLSMQGESFAGVLANDVDPDGDVLTAQILTQPANGSVSLNSNGTFTYTPNNGFQGTDTFTYQASDVTSSQPATVTVSVVRAGNTSPIAVADAYSIAEDGFLSVSAALGVLANDSDPEMDAITSFVTLQPANGILIFSPNGSFTYAPNPNFFGDDYFAYSVTDGLATSPSTTVHLTVTPVNDPPVVQNEFYVIDENSPIVADVPQSNGASNVTLINDGSVWSYLDNGSNQGTAWRATDFNATSWATGPAKLGYGDGDEATVVSFGPSSTNKYPTTYFRRSFTTNSAQLVSNLSLFLNVDDGCVVYLNGLSVLSINMPVNYDYLTYTTTQREGSTTTQHTIPSSSLVNGTNVIAVEVHQVTASSSDLTLALRLEATLTEIVGVLANDIDIEGSALTASLVAQPAHGLVSMAADGTFTYTPTTNYHGSDTFDYLVSDGTATSTGTVNITIIPGPNAIPVTQPDAYTIAEDTTLTPSALQGVLANDSDPDTDPLTAIVASQPLHGTLTLNSNGSFTYVPNAHYNGSDSFSYFANDSEVNSLATQVSITITPVDDAPVTAPDFYVIQPNGQISTNAATGVLANDVEVDGQAMSAQLLSSPANGALSLFSNGSFTYTPYSGFTGANTFTYRASDGFLTSAPVTVTLYVNARPTAVADSYMVAEDATLNVLAFNGLLKNDTDPSSESLTAVLVSPPVGGTFTLLPTGAFTYTPAPDFFGQVSFSYTANDPVQPSPAVSVNITVSPVNDAPVGTDDIFEVATTGTSSFSAPVGVLANDSDVDNSSGLTAVLVTDVSGGILTLSPAGSFSYTPGVGFNGKDSFTYRVSDGSLTSDPVTVILLDIAETSAIVINEIMYQPASESPLDEFIEIHNIATFPIDLNSWRITKGVDFTFPNITIPAGGYIIVAADPASFQTTYGTAATVVGPWIGQLSNSGELIRLRDDLDQSGDEVEYSDQGDWAQRVRVTIGGANGWEWYAGHDGSGQSLELINAALSNKNGQNWAASIGAPTPGAVNSSIATNIAPLISDVIHSPAVPKSTDAVTITARLKDVLGSALSASLRYRASTLTPGPFIDIPMFDDGQHGDGAAADGVFGVTLPPSANLTIIEFYVRASDGANVRTWPASTDVGQTANALFQFNDEVPDGQQMVYHLIMTATENQTFTNITRTSNAQMNTTLIIDDCSSWKVRYSCGTRVRGAGSRNHTPVPRRVNIPRDVALDGSTRMNLNTRYPYAQFIGMKLFRSGGMAAPEARPISMRRNGVNEMRGDGYDYGLAVHLEPLSGEFIDGKFPDDRQGNLYKKGRPDNDWAYRNGNFNSYITDGWGKSTNASESDYSDLDELMRVMNQTSGAGNYIAQVEAVANVDQWMKWFATNAILANGETSAATGADDDYSMYRGVIDPRFVFIPHDLDTIISLGDNSRITDPQHTLFDMLERGDTLGPLIPFFNNTQIRQRYYAAMRVLFQTNFSKPEFDELLNNQLIGLVPPATIASMITFMDARRTFIEGILTAQLGPPTTPTAATTRGTLTAGHGSIFINEVLAVNTSAYANGAAFPDAIELYNAGPTTVSLANMSISDDPAFPAKFTFAPGTSIPAGGYLVLHADSSLADPGIHLGFQLDSDGETLTLFNAAQQAIDTITYGIQIANFSVGRTGVNADVWTLTQPSLGASNTAVALGNPATLRINEWMAQPELVFEDDFVELYNPNALPVALGGLAVTDDLNTLPLRHVLPDLSFIPGSGFLLLTAKGTQASPGNATELPFKFASAAGWISIAGANGVLIDEIYYDCHRYDLAQGRSPDGSATYADFLLPTPGLSNGTDLSAQSAVISSLRITEIMYHPAGADAEYVELTNIGNQTIQLGGVGFNSGITFDFPAMTLAPGQFVLIVSNIAIFESVYGTGLPVAGAYSGKLSNSGERLRLEISAIGAGIHDFDYSDAWYPSTDGGGYALVIANPLISRHNWGLKESWIAGEPGGTPGENDLVVLTGASQSIVLGSSANLDATIFEGMTTPAQLTLTWTKESGPSGAVFTNPTAEDTSVSFTQPGRYLLKLTAATAQKSASGTVEIIVRDTYDLWVIRTFGAPNAPTTDRGFDADGDGVTNFLEFLFNTNPNAPGPLPITASIENGFLALTYTIRYVDSGEYSITPEVGTALTTWASATGSTTSTIIASNNETMTVQIRDIAPAGVNDKKFLRLKIVTTQ